MKPSSLLLIAALLVPAAAIAVKPAEIIKVRHQNFEGMGRAMKGLFDELRKPAPNFAVFKANATVIANSAPRIANHFPKGSGPESGQKTDALPTIWEKPGEFTAAAVASLAEARASAAERPITAREQSYIDGLALWLDGRPTAAADRIESALIDAPQEGDYVILHVGYAIGKLDADEAARTLALMDQLATSQSEAAP